MAPGGDGGLEGLLGAGERRGRGAASQQPAERGPRLGRDALQPAATRRGRLRCRQRRQPPGNLAAACLSRETPIFFINLRAQMSKSEPVSQSLAFMMKVQGNRRWSFWQNRWLSKTSLSE